MFSRGDLSSLYIIYYYFTDKKLPNVNRKKLVRIILWPVDAMRQSTFFPTLVFISIVTVAVNYRYGTGRFCEKTTIQQVDKYN